MEYSRILVAGLGSIGSFLCHGLLYLRNLKELIIFDHDSVELENIEKSVYTKKHIGKNKAFALKEILSNLADADISAHPTQFNETKIKQNDIDLIIDCRDIICTRNIQTLKLYISDRTLIIDGRKVHYETIEHGRYTSEINMVDLMNVSNIVTNMISSGAITNLLSKNKVIQVPLDADKDKIQNRIESIYNEDPDIVYDFVESSKISNIDDVSKKISTINKDRQLEIELITGSYTDTYIVNKRDFNSVYEVSEFITSLVSNLEHKTFVVYIEGNRIVITPEIGAA